MLTYTEIFIPVPRPKSTAVTITIGGTDVTKYVYDSAFTIPETVGIGTFNLTLANAAGRFSDTFKNGDEIIFKADYRGGNTTKFKGILDFPKDSMSRSGQFLQFEGRHKSWTVTEIKVSYAASNADPADILRAGCAKYASYLDTSGISNTGKSFSKTWDLVPFWDFVKDLCAAGDASCYIDDDLIIHFFPKNSVFNRREFIAENDNFISTDSWGKDTLFEKTRVVVAGSDSRGLPILYTAINGRDNTSTEPNIREVVLSDADVSTFEQAQSLAQAALNTNLVTAPFQGTITSLGLEFAAPGDNFWVAIFRQKIYGIYRAISLTHMFGRNGWRTRTVFERESFGILQTIESLSRSDNRQASSGNPNKHPYSFNFEFDNDNQTASNSSTQVVAGALKLSGSATMGTWASVARTVPADVMAVELDYVGKDLGLSTFEFSVDGKVSWETFTGRKILQVPAGTGNIIAVRVNLVKNSDTDPAPQLDSLVMLYTA